MYFFFRLISPPPDEQTYFIKHNSCTIMRLVALDGVRVIDGLMCVTHSNGPKWHLKMIKIKILLHFLCFYNLSFFFF